MRQNRNLWLLKPLPPSCSGWPRLILLVYLLQDGAFPCHGGDCAKSQPRNANQPTPNRAATMKKHAGFIKKFRLFIWRWIGPGANSGFRRVGRPICPKLPVEQTPLIARCAAFLPIVLRIIDICRRNFPSTVIQSPVCRRSRRLSSTVFIYRDCCAARFCVCGAADKRYSLGRHDICPHTV